ncbi:unnamed protein product [Heterosigma akashiwo]
MMSGDQKIPNGYGIKTSSLSITHLGMKGPQQQAWRDQPHVKRDLMCQLQAQKRVHAARKELYMQAGYPETLRKLKNGEIQHKQTPRELLEATRPLTMSQLDLRKHQYQPPPSASTQAFHGSLRGETAFNATKRRYLSRRGQAASVPEIIRQVGPGRGLRPGERPLLFPQDATHWLPADCRQALLGGPAARPPPPPRPQVAGRRAWLGGQPGPAHAGVRRQGWRAAAVAGAADPEAAPALHVMAPWVFVYCWKRGEEGQRRCRKQRGPCSGVCR